MILVRIVATSFPLKNNHTHIADKVKILSPKQTTSAVLFVAIQSLILQNITPQPSECSCKKTTTPHAHN
jgi:hypothetical protein